MTPQRAEPLPAGPLPLPAISSPPDIYENSCTLSSGEGQAQRVSFTFGN